MNQLQVRLFIFLLCFLGVCWTEATKMHAIPPNILEWDQGRKDRIETMLRRDTSFNSLNNYIIQTATKYIQTNPLSRKLRGIRLLDISQEVLKRSLYLSYSYHITGEEKYAIRAKKEILNVCSYSDWNPRHFLDVAEMSLAVSIGYGWLRDKFSREEKDSVVQAILEKAIKPAELLLPSKGFYGVSTNWNPVCNAGIVAAAISISSEYPEQSEKIIKAAENSNIRFINSFKPDGASPEGYGYWGYGMNFECLLLDMLESFRRKPTDVKTLHLLELSAIYAQCLATPSLGCYNYSDSSEISVSNLATWWISAYSEMNLTLIDRNLITYGVARIGTIRLLPIFIVFASRLIDKPYVKSLSKLNCFKGTNPILTFRDGYEDKINTYLGLKGGSASNPHGHMDSGSMIYENQGVRWLVELGSPDYYKKEKEGFDLWNMGQSSTRWSVTEISPAWHSTIQLDDTLHRVEGRAEILYVIDSKERVGGIIDMTTVLGEIQQAHRGVFVDSDRNLIISDTILNGLKSHIIDWHIITEAVPTIQSTENIFLNQDGKRAHLTLQASNPYVTPYVEKLRYKKNNSSKEKTYYKIGFKDSLLQKENYLIEAVLNILD